MLVLYVFLLRVSVIASCGLGLQEFMFLCIFLLCGEIFSFKIFQMFLHPPPHPPPHVDIAGATDKAQLWLLCAHCLCLTGVVPSLFAHCHG